MERLIVDSFYVDYLLACDINKEDVGYAKKAYKRLPKELKRTIEKHLR